MFCRESCMYMYNTVLCKCGYCFHRMYSNSYSLYLNTTQFRAREKHTFITFWDALGHV